MMHQRLLSRCVLLGKYSNNFRGISVSSHKYNYEDGHRESRSEWNRYGIISFTAAAGVAAGLACWMRESHYAESDNSLTKVEKGLEKYGAVIEGLPVYTLDDVAKHATIADRVWLSYRNGVYDVTDFIHEHPGGDKILLGAGGSTEPFWALYAVHKSPHVLEMLEKYRIGNLSPDDVNATIKDMTDPYCNEPRRHVALKPSSKKPFNAEPPLSLLVDNFITPNDLFYVRNHLPVPQIDVNDYELDICGVDVKETSFKLDDIKKFPKHTITSAVQCGGNRRSEMMKVKTVKGLSWGQAAISNATWSGARLYDVLKSLGIDENMTKALHVQFEGLDTDPTNSPYGSSIPIEKALDPRGDVLLAYEMNGEPIPRDHGFPLRVIVPGVVGARNVKWIGRIVISEEESKAHWQQNDYKGFSPNIDWHNVDFTKSPAIQDMPVTSAICDPSEGDKIKVVGGKVKIRGYAYSGGGCKIVRVDVSSDGGKTWQAADNLESDSTRHTRSWSWTLWTAEIPVDNNAQEIQVCAKAVDSQYNTQPENFENIWNLRGVLSNAYHRVNVKLER